MSRLDGANVVIAASQFNPSVFSELWLFRNKIATVDELENAKSKHFSSQVAQLITQNFNLTILPQQLVFSPEDPLDAAELLMERIGGIVDLVPHTPFSGIGVNFIWRVHQDEIEAFSRSLFLPPDSPLQSEFSTPDCLYGGYFSKDVLGCRLKLDVKPVAEENEGKKSRCLVLSFNFHRDLTSEDASKRSLSIKEHLAVWTNAFEKSKSVTASVQDKRY